MQDPDLQPQIAFVSTRTQLQIENNNEKKVNLTKCAQRAGIICHQHR